MASLEHDPEEFGDLNVEHRRNENDNADDARRNEGVHRRLRATPNGDDSENATEEHVSAAPIPL